MLGISVLYICLTLLMSVKSGDTVSVPEGHTLTAIGTKFSLWEEVTRYEKGFPSCFRLFLRFSNAFQMYEFGSSQSPGTW